MRQECKICGRTPHEIPEYTEAAEIEENEAQERYKKS